MAWVAGAIIPRQVSDFCSSIFSSPPPRSSNAPLDVQRSSNNLLAKPERGNGEGRRAVSVGGGQDSLGESDSFSTVNTLPHPTASPPPIAFEGSKRGKGGNGGKSKRGRRGRADNGGKGSEQRRQELAMKMKIVKCVKVPPFPASVGLLAGCQSP